MPLDALSTIMQYESGGQNIQQQVVDPSISSASGYYQITVSTFNSVVVPATGLPKVGPGTDYPNGVMDLSRAQQDQAATALFQAQGFKPWTCTGCNPALAKYVADQGGESAFGLNGDNAITAGDVTGAGSTGLPDISFTSADGSVSSASMPAVSDTPGPLSLPFTWLYKQTIDATAQVVATDITAMQTAVGSYAEPLLILALIALGIRAWVGRSYD